MISAPHEGRCHWRGCILRRLFGAEFCEQHQKAFKYFGAAVRENTAYKADPWDGYDAWMVGAEGVRERSS